MQKNENLKTLYLQHKNTIKKTAKKYAYYYNINDDEVWDELFELFLKAVKNYDAERGASFNTFLFHSFREMSQKCKKLKKFKSLNFAKKKMNDDMNISRLMKQEARRMLSAEAMLLLDDINAGKFNKAGKTKSEIFPKYFTIWQETKKLYKWKNKKIKIILEEIENYYNYVWGTAMSLPNAPTHVEC